LKRLFPNIKKKSVQQQVSEYLDKNTEASFDTLKSAFPDISPNSLSAYKSVWKKEQPEKQEPDKQDKQEKPTAKQPDKPATKKKQLDKIAKSDKPKVKQTVKFVKKKDKPVKETKLDKPAKKDDTELIQSLRKTIAANEKTIKTLSDTFEQLNPESDAEELKGMTLTEIKRITATYLKSIKELPAKLKR